MAAYRKKFVFIGGICIEGVCKTEETMAISNEPINVVNLEDKQYVDKLWQDFKEQYDFIGGSGRYIKYPEREFRVQGIPAPWQTIAWRKIIDRIGEERFSKLPFELNYLGNENVLFERQFTKHFGNHPEPGRLEVTFLCGYFWRYTENNRRDKMMNFIASSLLEKDASVEIYTQDKTLKKDFNKVLGNHPGCAKPSIHVVGSRLDVHYTLILDNSAWENSLLLLELPHTEAHTFRLETYFTFSELRKNNCDPAKFIEFLQGYKKRGFKKWAYTLFNVALNM